ncbi:replication factor C subunit 1-like [Portunus trituberculatus]|uniref:replication factor C subunit 1-like n=1 Tax=Portunus trituberculatus TaxID=210409 RepID=UPI001E1CB297|nr:replication factor C subunit 1-like [Portunus trituberculatus]
MDIRRYFAPAGGSKPSGTSQHSKPKKKRNVIHDSDEESPSPVVTKKQRIVVLDSDSDEELFKKSSKKEEKISKTTKHNPQQKPESPKYKPITAASFFGTEPVTSKDKITSKKKNNDSSEKAFEKTLQQLDEEDFEILKEIKESSKHRSAVDHSSKSSESFEKTLKQLDEQKTHHKEVKASPKHSSVAEPKPKPNENSPPEKKTAKEIPAKQSTASKLGSKLKRFEFGKRDHGGCQNEDELQHKDKKVKLVSEEKERMPKYKRDSPQKKTSPQKDIKVKSEQKKSTKEEKIDTDSKKVSGQSSKEGISQKEDKKDVQMKERHIVPEKKVTPKKAVKENTQAPDTTPQDEKKKAARDAYLKFRQRSGPANPGSKEIPEGKPDCLQGLVFVLSGVFDSLDREEATEIVKKYGGKVTTSVSRNTSYLVVGVEAGESKLKKAEQLGTKQIDEDGLLELIATLPGKESKEATPKQATSGSSKLKKFARESEPKEAPTLASQSASPSTPDSLVTSTTTPKRSLSSSQASLTSQESGSPSSSTSSPRTQSISSQELNSRSEDALMWVDKYKPASTKNIIGQQGGASNVKKLLNWLQNWQKNQLGDKRPPMPSPWAKDDTGGYYKAALLSGPPGVGKTTTAHLVCKEMGYDVLELNASDARSKKSIDQVVSELLGNKSLAGFATGGGHTSSRHALVMDEVDGMSGNEDRGGVQELIALIKKSKIPIIAMCNDRNHPKIRSLANHCFDLRFYKPRIEQIRGPMMSVCYREGIKIKSEALDQIIIGSNQDIRQVLHHLSMWSVKEKNLQTDDVKKEAKKAHKDFKKGPWDVCRTVFTESEHKNLNIHEKSDLFFNDYSIAPLFVQENYPKVVPHSAKGNRRATLQQLAKTAASVADGDLVGQLIRSHGSWSLLPTQAMFSSVIPGEYMSGHLAAQIDFPAWFGKNSRRNKLDRLAQELQMHMRLRISGSKRDVGMDYCEMMRDIIVTPLVKYGAEGVDKAVEAMNSYDLLREDLESLLELSSWPNSKNPMNTVESKVKAAFTRKFNKDCHLTPFAAPSIKKKKGKPSDSYGEEEGEESEDEEEEEDDLGTSGMIKVKVGGSKGQGSTAGAGRGRGRGRGGGATAATRGGRGRAKK